MKFREFSNKDELSDLDWEGVALGEHVPIKVETWWRDAERVAFARVRKRAKGMRCVNIFYRSYSGQNPDFMNGTDRTSHFYRIDAVVW